MENQETLFVYGTLKQGGRWHHLLSTARFLGAARTTSAYPLVIDDFPYLLNEPGAGMFVEGELYLVDAPTLARLDALEGHPTEYCRERRIMRSADGASCEAWVYFVRDPKIITRIKERELPAIASFDVGSR